MIKYLNLALLLVITLTLSGQNIDTSVYNNRFEKIKFIEVQEGDELSIADLLYAINYDKTTYEKSKARIQKLKNSLDDLNVSSKPLKKQVKIIYKQVHAQFFKKYEENVCFNTIFYDGRYNCVTASSLFCMVFDMYGIPYQVKETPTHVYLIVDPDSQHILVETTTPAKGVIYYNEKSKRDYIDYLRNNKIISEQEYTMNSLDNLFNDYFQKDEVIGFKELVAINYYNSGISFFNKEEFVSALHQFEKAKLLYASNTIKYMHNASILNVMNEDMVNKSFNGKRLAAYLKASVSDSKSTQLGQEYFNALTNEYALNSPNISKYKHIYQSIKSEVSDSVNMTDIENTFHLYCGNYYHSQSNFDSCFYHLQKAYVANPSNIQVKELIKNAAINYMAMQSMDEVVLDSVDSYLEAYPFLLKDNRIMHNYFYSLTSLITEYIEYDEYANAKPLLDKFEDIAFSSKHPDIRKDFIDAIYTTLCAYHAEKENITKAKAAINRGLELSPRSRDLRMMQEMLKSAPSAYRPIQTNITYQPERLTKMDVFDREFPGKWKTISVSDYKGNDKIKLDNYFELTINSDKKFELRSNGKSVKGNWSVRSKSQLLYLMPNGSRDNYLVFSIISIDEKELKLKPYEANKKPVKMYVILKKVHS